MFTNICLLLIAFMLGLNVCFLFCIGKVLKDLVDKYHSVLLCDVWGYDTSSEDVSKLVSLLLEYLARKIGGDL